MARRMSKEERFGFWVSGGIHIAFAIIALFIYVGKPQTVRPAFVAVDLGNFSQGKPTQYAPKKQPKVATRPHPSKVQPPKPQPEKPVKKEETPQKKQEKVAKSANLPDQKQQVKAEPLKTPKTSKINPQKNEDKKQQEISVPPKTAQSETSQEGAKTSGDVNGQGGDVKSDQGTGNENKKSAPYSLKWEGNIDRTPIVQPLPDYTEDVEAVITVRFEVLPDGLVGRIIPLKKGDPDLEKEVIKTLRGWRFSQLPSGVPQQPQWGTITFRFVLE